MFAFHHLAMNRGLPIKSKRVFSKSTKALSLARSITTDHLVKSDPRFSRLIGRDPAAIIQDLSGCQPVMAIPPLPHGPEKSNSLVPSALLACSLDSPCYWFLNPCNEQNPAYPKAPWHDGHQNGSGYNSNTTSTPGLLLASLGGETVLNGLMLMHFDGTG